MLRHRLPQSVWAKNFRPHHVIFPSRFISITPLLGGSSPRAQHSRLSEINQFLDHAKPAQTSFGKCFSSSGPEYSRAYTSSSHFEKYSTDKSDTSTRQWKTERSQFEERDDKSSFLPKYRSTRKVRLPRADSGGHLYDNYKPREQTRSKTKPQSTRSPSRADTSFDILQAIQTAFPHVEKPTSIQARLIPAIIQGSDVILMDETGSGKTFGSVLALLPEISQPHGGITTLYVVPHRDLAYQIESWCQRLVSAQPSTPIDPSTVARVIARPNTTPQTFADIRKNPPRILISTPGALIDAMQFGGLHLETTLRRIVIDEVDAVMKIPLRYRHVQLRNQHTPEVAQVIDKLLRLMWEGRRSKPQMVMMSATLKIHVRSWLFKQKGWMAERVVRLHGIQEKLESGEFESSERSQVTHSAVVVEADGRLCNLSDEQDRDSEPEEKERGILSEDPGAVLEFLDQEDQVLNVDGSSSDASRQTTLRPTKGLILPPSVLEAVATSVALDVSHRALLVIPTGVSIDPVVETLRGFGVETRTLNLREEIEHVSTRPEEEPEGHTNHSSPRISQIASSDHHSPVEQNEDAEEFVPNPTLLVATATAVRGIDIPTLSHVYIVGGLESEEAYRHVAGRAGRFGMPGSVVSFVGADGAEKLLGGTGERRIRRTFGRIGVQNKPFPHI
ncbi:P-loop containing nucleoside triphosphate hydrolase protein [Rhizoctonia solani]|nr:P-loop containing nucleoside triphosphate hydrolase protein [Rhizoctonia solani]